MIKTIKNKNRITMALFAVMIAVQIIIALITGYNKKNLFCDEVFTYGLSNCEDYAFLNKETFDSFGYNGWVDSDFLKHYVDVDKETPWSFNAAYNNQVADVHPPMYYFFMHFMCILFGGEYTKWSGLFLNLFILIGIDFGLYCIGKIVFEKDKIKAILPALLWSCSAVGLSNIIFIRMYLMLTLECILFVVVHIGVLKTLKTSRDEKVFTVKRLLGITSIVIFGGLTHYYFYPFAFFLGAPVCVILLAKKKIKSLFIYILSMLVGFGINLLIFPETIHHVLDRARGTEVLTNLTGRTGNIYPKYLNMIDKSMFGGCVLPVLVICGSAAIYLFVKKRKSFTNRIGEREGNGKQKKDLVSLINSTGLANTLFAVISIATYGFLIIAIQGSQLIANRYIWQAYPFLAIVSVKLITTVLSGLLNNKKIINIILAVCVIVFCSLSINVYGIEYQYSEYDREATKTSDLRGCDCIAYNRYDFIDIYTTLFISLDYDETYLIRPNEVENVSMILDGRRTKDKLVLWVPTLVSEEETQEFLEDIMSRADYTEYIYRGNYLRMQVFELK